MSSQGDFFDTEEGERRKEDALERVEEGGRGWIEQHALPAIRSCARFRDTLTTDDIWWYLVAAAAPSPTEPRAMGAAMRKAGAEKTIVPTENWLQSERPECNRRHIRVWRSLTREYLG